MLLADYVGKKRISDLCDKIQIFPFIAIVVLDL